MVELYLAVFLGSLIYLGFQLNGVYPKPEFEWKIFRKTNIVAFALNILIGFTLVFIREALVLIYPITLVSALILGFSGQAIFKKLTSAADKNIPTKLGLKGK